MGDQCYDTPEDYYDSKNCQEDGTWLATSNGEWLLSSGLGYYSSYINAYYYLYNGPKNVEHTVRPTVYVDPNEMISSGSGTFEDPYIFEGNESTSDFDTIEDKLIDDNTVKTLVPVGDELRFRGATVNNYVTFNDESWRIMGFINDRIKLIKTTHLANTMAWDIDDVNDWTTASLQEYLNGEYYNNLTPSAQNMTETVTYKLGGYDVTYTIDQTTAAENGSNVYSGHPVEITNTKIALMYMSDYMYSMSADCTKYPTDYGYYDACKAAGTWLYNGGKYERLLSPNSEWKRGVSFIIPSGHMNHGQEGNGYANARDPLWIRPSLYLKSTVKISGGNGTLGNPYTLSEG